MAEVAEKQMIFTTKFVDEATEKINDGIVIKRFQNPWPWIIQINLHIFMQEYLL